MTERLPELQITSLRVNEYRGAKYDVPYLVINATFKVDPDTSLWQMAKGESKEYAQRLTIDDPEKYEQWIMRESWDLKDRYPGYGRAWLPQEVPWQYIEKFDTFWFRSWSADSTVTRAIISELQYYAQHQKLPSVYRSTDESIVLDHLRTLGETYWD
jgi:hypothetical protein